MDTQGARLHGPWQGQGTARHCPSLPTTASAGLTFPSHLHPPAAQAQRELVLRPRQGSWPASWGPRQASRGAPAGDSTRQVRTGAWREAPPLGAPAPVPEVLGELHAVRKGLGGGPGEEIQAGAPVWEPGCPRGHAPAAELVRLILDARPDIHLAPGGWGVECIHDPLVLNKGRDPQNLAA